MNWRDLYVPPQFRKLYEQGRAGKAKAAIRAHCLMCVGWEAAEVAKCTATGCPLYELRNKSAQAHAEMSDREKRRARAKASGARPPQHASASGRGAHVEGQNSNAIDRVATTTQP